MVRSDVASSKCTQARRQQQQQQQASHLKLDSAYKLTSTIHTTYRSISGFSFDTSKRAVVEPCITKHHTSNSNNSTGPASSYNVSIGERAIAPLITGGFISKAPTGRHAYPKPSSSVASVEAALMRGDETAGSHDRLDRHSASMLPVAVIDDSMLSTRVALPITRIHALSSTSSTSGRPRAKRDRPTSTAAALSDNVQTCALRPASCIGVVNIAPPVYATMMSDKVQRILAKRTKLSISADYNTETGLNFIRKRRSIDDTVYVAHRELSRFPWERIEGTNWMKAPATDELKRILDAKGTPCDIQSESGPRAPSKINRKRNAGNGLKRLSAGLTMTGDGSSPN